MWYSRRTIVCATPGLRRPASSAVTATSSRWHSLTRLTKVLSPLCGRRVSSSGKYRDRRRFVVGDQPLPGRLHNSSVLTSWTSGISLLYEREVKRWRPIIFNNTQTRADSGSGQQILAATTIRQHIGNKFLFLVMIVLFANATGCSYLRGTLPDGKIAVEVVSSKLAKKLAEPDAG